MSTKIVLVVLSTCLIRLLISSSVSGFPSTNSFLRLGSSLTTSSFFSWLFLKSTSWSPFNHCMLLGRKDNLLSFTFRHVNENKYKYKCRYNKLLQLKYSNWICASNKGLHIRILMRNSISTLFKFRSLRFKVFLLKANFCLTTGWVPAKRFATKSNDSKKN